MAPAPAPAPAPATPALRRPGRGAGEAADGFAVPVPLGRPSSSAATSVVAGAGGPPVVVGGTAVAEFAEGGDLAAELVHRHLGGFFSD